MASSHRSRLLLLLALCGLIILSVVVTTKYETIKSITYEMLYFTLNNTLNTTQTTVYEYTSNLFTITGINESVSMQYFALPKFNSVARKAQAPFVIYIKSSVDNIERRNAIRNTWGQQAQELNVPVVFAIGSSAFNSTKLQNF